MPAVVLAVLALAGSPLAPLRALPDVLLLVMLLVLLPALAPMPQAVGVQGSISAGAHMLKL